MSQDWSVLHLCVTAESDPGALSRVLNASKISTFCRDESSPNGGQADVACPGRYRGCLGGHYSADRVKGRAGTLHNQRSIGITDVVGSVPGRHGAPGLIDSVG